MKLSALHTTITKVPGIWRKLTKKVLFRGSAPRQGWSLILTLIVARAFNAEAEEPEQPFNELFMSGMVYTQEKRELQAGVMPTFKKGDDERGWELPFGIEYGLTDRLQLEAEWSAFEREVGDDGEASQGTGNVGFGLQYSFMQIADSNAHAAVAFELEIPSGHSEVSEGFLEYEPTFLLAYDLPSFHQAQVFATIGMEFVDRIRSPEDPTDREPSAHSLSWSTGMFIPFDEWVASVELSGSSNTWNHGGEEREIYLTPGFTWLVTEHLEIGLGLPVGVNERAENFLVIGKLIIEY